MPVSIAPSPPPARPTDPAPPRLWGTGTLVYTTSGLVVLFVWLLWGDFAWHMKDRAVVPLAQLMLRQYQASDFLVGLLVGSVPAALGFILGPIISVKSDRHRGPRGRRIPYLLLPTPFITLGMVGLAFTGPISGWLHSVLGDSSPGQVACRLGSFAFFWMMFEIFQTIAQSVFYGLINDVVPTALIGRFFGLFRAISLLVGIVFNFWLIDFAETHATALFLGLGLVFGAGFLLMCLKVREGDYPPPPPPGPRLTFADRFLRPVSRYFRECFTRPFYLWIFIAITLGNLAGVPVNSFSVFHAKSLGLNMDAYGKLVGVTFVCSLVLSFFLGWLADKFHPIRLGIVALAAYAALMIWGGFASGGQAGFAAAFVAHGVLMGTFLTGTASLGQRLFPRENFAQFMSAASIAGAPAYMILPPTLGLFLDATGHVYRHAFLLSGLIGLGAFAAFLMVYRQYRRLGGDASYSPPTG